MACRRNTVGGQLAVRLEKCSLGRQKHTGSRHQLPFERIAVNVDKGRGKDHAACVNPNGAIGGPVQPFDPPLCDAKTCGYKTLVQKNTRAFDDQRWMDER